MASLLDQLRRMTVVVADTCDVCAIEKLRLVDCTTNPPLLAELAAEGTLERKLSPQGPREMPELPAADEHSLRWEMNESVTATEKLAEGIRRFGADLRALHALIWAHLEGRADTLARCGPDGPGTPHGSPTD